MENSYFGLYRSVMCRQPSVRAATPVECHWVSQSALARACNVRAGEREAQ
jgi:hypothetical protein